MNTFYWSQNTLKAATYDTYTKALYHFEDTTDATANGYSLTLGIDSTATPATGTSTLGTNGGKFGTGYLNCANGKTQTGISSNGDFNLTSVDFTIDCWIKSNVALTYWRSIFCLINTAGNRYLICGFHPSFNYCQFVWSNGTSEILNVNCSFTALSTTAWHHVAVVRSGSSFMIFINGVKQTVTYGQGSGSSTLEETTKLYIGGSLGQMAYKWSGYIDEFRVSKGIARWTANFTPPTSAYTPT